VLEEKGRVDVLINNAGIGVMCEIKDMDRGEWERLVGINYWGVVNCIEFFLPDMIRRGSGHIVNVASANGLFAFPFGGAYASTKFAVVGLSEALRAELKRFGIGVTTVCPGLTATNILRDGIIKPGSDRAKNFMDDFQGKLDKMGVDPMKIARAIPPAILKNKALVRVPFHVVPVDIVHRFAPGLYRRVIAVVSTREN
jgi:short-subunit dehydrogenase